MRYNRSHAPILPLTWAFRALFNIFCPTSVNKINNFRVNDTMTCVIMQDIGYRKIDNVNIHKYVCTSGILHRCVAISFLRTNLWKKGEKSRDADEGFSQDDWFRNLIIEDFFSTYISVIIGTHAYLLKNFLESRASGAITVSSGNLDCLLRV